jgi:hypothetical protein
MEHRLLSKEAIGPIRSWLQNAKVESGAKLKERRHKAFAPTENPLTSPGFVPLAAITAPESFRKGFTQADADAAAVRNELLGTELEQAKQEFERALSEEYKGRKAASAGEWLDNFTDKVFALEKRADSDQGDAMKWLNAYLGTAALLGYGTHRAAESFTSRHDSARQKHKLYRMALRQRMHDKGVPVMVDFNDLPAAKEEMNLTDELPVQEMKEASEGARGGALLPIIRTLVSRPSTSIMKPPSDGMKKIIATIKGRFPMPESMRKPGQMPKKATLIAFCKRARAALLGAEGMNPSQVADFNTTGRVSYTPGADTTQPSSFTPSTARVPGAPDYNAPLTSGRPSPGERTDALASNESIYGAAPPPIPEKYRMPANYTPPPGSRMEDAWKAIASNRENLGFQPGSAEWAQNARQHAYEGEQVYQKLHGWVGDKYQDMANRGMISPVKNEEAYNAWREGQRNAVDRADMEARAARFRQATQGSTGMNSPTPGSHYAGAQQEVASLYHPNGPNMPGYEDVVGRHRNEMAAQERLQDDWNRRLAQGGAGNTGNWQANYPKGTHFDDPTLDRTPEQRMIIARGNRDKMRNQQLDSVEAFAGRQRAAIAARQDARREFANRARF